uniref:PD-(D/E)XK nuclease family protein n=1 Tax=Streptomyces niveus TaxID=193462 RepID=UPI000A9D367D
LEGRQIAFVGDLAALKEAFDRTPYARRTPYRVEAPFQLTLAGRVIRGRIDAVYRDVDPATDTVTYEIVDWKTGHGRTADPLQLAVYRLAWAEQHGIPPDAVTATFLYVRSGETVRPEGLPGRTELERVLLYGSDDADGAHDADDRPSAAGPGEHTPEPRLERRTADETTPGAG